MSDQNIFSVNLNRILVVDDDPIVLTALRRLLTSESFDVTVRPSSVEALDSLGAESYAVVLADQDMPDMPGLEFLGKVRDAQPMATRLLLANGSGGNTISEAIKSGHIYRFILKPWMREELLMTIHNSVEHYRYLVENKELHQNNLALNSQISRLAPREDEAAAGPNTAEEDAGAARAGADPINTNRAVDLTVAALVKLLYAFHPHLGNNAMRAYALCQTLGESLELSPRECKNLLWAAALHDISLVGVEHGLLRKWLRWPDRCTAEEMQVIKNHPARSQEMVGFNPMFKEAGMIIASHHENWDGTGYPAGLRGEEIPWLSRLLSAVIYSCATHAPSIQVMSDMEAQGEKMFDPKAIAAVARVVPLTKLPRGEREIQLIELKGGMVLARDIYNVNGFLLLPKGRELTETAINKLFSINRETQIDPLVLVYC